MKVCCDVGRAEESQTIERHNMVASQLLGENAVIMDGGCSYNVLASLLLLPVGLRCRKEVHGRLSLIVLLSSYQSYK